MAVIIKKVVNKDLRDIHMQIKAVYDEDNNKPTQPSDIVNFEPPQPDIVNFEPPQPDITRLDPPQTDEVHEPGNAGTIKDVVYKLPNNVTIPALIDETSPIDMHIEEIICDAKLNPGYNYTFKYNGRTFDPKAKAIVMHVNDGDQIEIVQI